MIDLNVIEETLKYQLHKNLPAHKISEVYFYATLPGGKFFRPMLAWSICKDLDPKLFDLSFTNKNSTHSLLATSLELHHTYTLLHDDLPCMDDDQMRRGKPCTHIKYNEWMALLAGDGLLNISYQLVSKIKHPNAMNALNFYSWATGPKGLIHGQVLDLSHEMKESMENTLKTHELKTARLIQVAICTSAMLTDSKLDTNTFKKLYRFSKLLGINFQLIDDLSELAEKDLGQHEIDVNPWLHFTDECYKITLKNLENFEHLSKELNLIATNAIVKNYYQKMLSIIVSDLDTINEHLKNKVDLAPIVLSLKSFGNL